MSLFSIIVACYNAGDQCRNTLETVAAQTFTDYEVVIKDAASTDGCLERAADAIAAIRKKGAAVEILSEKDRGIYDGMNAGIRAAKGEYIYFLNCGDLFYNETVLERVAEEIRRHSAANDYGSKESASRESALQSSGSENDAKETGLREDAPLASRERPAVYYGDIAESITGQIVPSNPVTNDFSLYRNVPCHQACFYAASLFAERGFDLSYPVRADYEHYLYCYYERQASFYAMPFPIAYYEGGGFSASKENRAQAKAEHRAITRRYIPTGKRALYGAYLLLTLQPLREKIAGSKRTAGLYDRAKRLLYGRKRKKS